jgi:hypothetical protein
MKTLQLVKTAWNTEGMTDMVQAAPKNADGTLQGLDIVPNAKALNALLEQLDQVLTDNAGIIAAIEKVT